MSKTTAWYMLLLAIALEVTGTSLMKFFATDKQIEGYIFMLIFISLSYFSLSKVVMKIPISTAYAIWEGLGLVGTTFIAWLIFNENMPLTKLFAFILILSGLIMIKKGTFITTGDEKNV